MDTRCTYCRRKLKLAEKIVGKCRCELIYCLKHRNEHICSFDYRKDQMNQLIKNNPQIIAEKIDRI